MLFLGPLFFVVYGGTNWLTSLRQDVGTFYFDWETGIPFIPVLIIPYMSIDLFFAGSTVLCGTRGELRALVKRIVFAILISAVGFLLFPLRFAFSRPEVPGGLGAIFSMLSAFDQPYNLVPSLHISLLASIWPVYHRHTAGLLRWAINGWFVLVGLSTLFIYQHHVIDVLSGALVAVCCFYLFPDTDDWRAAPVTRNLSVASRYALLALSALILTYAGWPWSILLAWPAISLSILALAYAGLGPAVFRKAGGRLPWSARIVLAPYLTGAWLSYRYYRCLGPAWGEIVQGILVGRRLDDAEAGEAVGRGVTAVLDLTAEYGECARFLSLPYRNVQVLDLTAPTVAHLDDAVAFIRDHHPRGSVYVHCALGYSRSACVVAAYLLAEGIAATVAEAIEYVRRARPEIVMTPQLLYLLRAYQVHAETLDSNPAAGDGGTPAGPPVAATLLAALARVLAGAQVRWVGCHPEPCQRIYFANHTSHLDALVLWSALPRGLQALTRPVAAKDYWGTGNPRRYLATRVFNAVLLERVNLDDVGRRQQLDLLLEAMGDRYSLILFPEGTRGTGEEIAPFKSGLYHLALKRPDVELVPVYLDNLDRILPKGALIPVPLLSSVSFGSPLRVLPGEEKDAFLERAREAVRALESA